MTQKEIAETLNVSIATVSLALSDSPKISNFTKEKIKNFVRIVKYKPNLIAKNLATGKTFTIGIFFPSVAHSFYGELVREIQINLKNKNYIGIFLPIEIFEKNQDAIDILLNRRVDGIISTYLNMEEIVRLQEEKFY